MHITLGKIRQSIEWHRLFLTGQHILVAVSGGADSVALLVSLHDLAPWLAAGLTAAHLNHRIRGKEADDDAAFVKALSARLDIPYVEGCCDVPRRARRKGLSLEMAAREARYAFFSGVARKVGADVVATAHTADDQAETILLKLTRGAGSRGLSGIARETVLNGLRVVRPMLNVTRREIIAFLRDRRFSWREDVSNRDLSFLRNRVRHEILPLLESKLNPKVRRALLHAAEILGGEDKWMEDIATSILADCTSAVSDGLNVETLKRHPLAARRRALRLWLAASGVPPDLIDFDTVNRVDLLLCAKKGSGHVTVAKNRIVKRQYEQLLVGENRFTSATAKFRESVTVPGETLLAENRLRVITCLARGVIKARSARAGILPARASIRLSAIGRRKLFVRSWRPGDRMKPLGLKGSKKLQDIFVDEKVPEEHRVEVPLFECAGQIIWLPGYRVATGWEVKDRAVTALQINVERI